MKGGDRDFVTLSLIMRKCEAPLAHMMMINDSTFSYFPFLYISSSTNKREREGKLYNFL